MVAEPVPIGELRRLFGDISVFYFQLVDRIGAAIETVFVALAATIENLFVAVTNKLLDIVTAIAKFIDGALADIVRDIQQLIADTSEFVKSTLKEVAGFIAALLRDTGEIFTQIFDKVFLSIDTLTESSAALLSGIFDAVVDNIERITIEVELQLRGLFGVVREGVETVLGSVDELINAMNRNIQESIALITNLVDGSLRSLLDLISNLPAEIAELTKQIIESARTNIAEPIGSLPLQLIKTLIETISGEPLEDADNVFTSALDIMFGTSPVERDPEVMRGLITASLPKNPLQRILVTTLMYPLIMMATLGGVVSANAQILLQEHAVDNPYRLLDPADLIRSKHFELLSENDTITDLRKHGHTEPNARLLTQIAKTVAPEAEQVVWWLRGFISEEEFNLALQKHGWTQEETSKLKQSAFFIPPVQDLISMAVREVFTPEVSERFGQFEDFPPQFVEQAAKVGLSKEWALNYWGAHWSLPSVQMGFEMLHRKVIVKEELDLLLRSADVMPFWRDKLIAISYNPLTRVDIRRMHKMGVLSNDQVLSAYEDIGYIDTDAQLLLDFTIALNEPSMAQDADDLSSLTRANIIGFFKDGVFSYQESETLLQNLGLSEDAAQLYLDGAAAELQRVERKDEIGIIIDRADSGVITFDEAQDALNRLGLETNEIQLALAELTKRQARRTKLPSRGDLDKMLGKKLIDEKEYLITMNRIGYSTVWAKRYLQLISGA